MKKKMLLFAAVFVMAFAPASFCADTGTTVGGHIKMTLFDAADGVRTAAGGVKYGSTEFTGFSFGEVILYISQTLSDVLSVEVEPSFRASTGATPKFGSNIGDNLSSESAAFGGFNKALIKYTAPMEVEISAGLLKPLFTVEYGQELFWDEEFNGSKFAANPWLGEMADTGIEIYKSFAVGDAAIPVWLYAMNGYGAEDTYDNNRQPAVMIHTEPAMGMFKVMGSYTVGTYDTGRHNAYQRASGGIQFNWEALQLRAEIANGRWENKMGAGKDAATYGYYIKAAYKFMPWLKLVYNYNVAAHNFNGFFYTANLGGEKYITNTAVLDMNLSDSTYVMLQVDCADWMQNNGADGLQFVRPTLAVRMTF